MYSCGRNLFTSGIAACFVVALANTNSCSEPDREFRQQKLSIDLIRYIDFLHRSKDQRYSRWKRIGDQNVYRCTYRVFPPDSDDEHVHTCFFFPNQDTKHIYYYNTQSASYFGRFNIEQGPYSQEAWQWVPDDRRLKGAAGEFPRKLDFAPSVAMPGIPGQTVRPPTLRMLWPTMQGLPDLELFEWDVAARPVQLNPDSVNLPPIGLELPAAPSPAPAPPVP